jgi:nicotinamide mononucleotide transporter
MSVSVKATSSSTAVRIGLSIVATALAVVVLSSGWFGIQVPAIEAVAVATGGWSVYLLSQNKAAGWFVGLVSVAAFGWVFVEARLYAEVGIQIFYFVTSLQAIYLWLRGGGNHGVKSVAHIPGRLVLITVPIFLISLVVLRVILVELEGAAPFWDALTTVMSLTAHIYLMWRFVESWYIWIAVDIIYVPLYLSRGLHLTSALYVVFLFMAISGLFRFRRLAAIRTGATP